MFVVFELLNVCDLIWLWMMSEYLFGMCMKFNDLMLWNVDIMCMLYCMYIEYLM